MVIIVSRPFNFNSLGNLLLTHHMEGLSSRTVARMGVAVSFLGRNFAKKRTKLIIKRNKNDVILEVVKI